MVAVVPTGTLTFSTVEGLVAPGSAAVLKVYVVLTTGNKRYSTVVRITRRGRVNASCRIMVESTLMDL